MFKFLLSELNLYYRRLLTTSDIGERSLRDCLYGRQDGTFAGTGRFSSQHNIVRQSGTECLYDKNYPAFPPGSGLN